MNAEQQLPALISPDTKLRLVEPHIYSAYAPGQAPPSTYDRGAKFYDTVIGNRHYNRLMWNFAPSELNDFCREALESSTQGWVLDAACGSLVFTIQAYAGYTQRPVVLLDLSIGMLRAAKARLVKLHGDVPENLVFLQGDVLQLPFDPGSFDTLISLNVLHVLPDARGLLTGLREALAEGGTLSLTSLVANTRLGGAYLKLLRLVGEAAPARNPGQVLAAFDKLGLPVRHRVSGCMMFVRFPA
jgi:SAM-dependent methyltransferase